MKENNYLMNVSAEDKSEITDEILAIISAAVETCLSEKEKRTVQIIRGSHPLSPWCSKTFLHRQTPVIVNKK
ncbi:MAG TPA: hypothetical protein PKY63_10520 [Bacteroidales bacterium]|nr:hypothetical protein [Bacteroidales bacterium]